MIIQKRNRSPKFIFISFLVMIVIFFYPLNVKNVLWNYYEKISTFDFGASSIHQMFGGSVKEPKNIIRFIKKTPRALKNIMFGVDRKKEIQNLYIDIKFKHYRKILDERIVALGRGVKTNFQNYNAELTFNNKKYNAKIGLKGLLNDHWRSKHRFSLKIKLKGNNSIEGMKEFSIHKPQSRQYPFDNLFQELVRGFNNISPNHSIYNVYVNGENWGIMDVEERINSEFLEKQKRKESIVLEIGGDQDFVYRHSVDSLYNGYRISDPNINVRVINSEKYLVNETNRKWYSYIIENINKPYLFENNSFSKALILSLIWGNTHVLQGKNLKFYFNPYTLKLTPITTDQGWIFPLNKKIDLEKPFDNLIKTNLFKNNFEKNFNEVEKVILGIDSILEKWQNYFPLDNKVNLKNLDKNKKFIVDNLNFLINQDYSKKEFLKLNMINETQAKKLPQHIYARHFENGKIHIYNLTREDLKIKKIKIDSIELNQFIDFEIKGVESNDYNPVIIDSNIIGLNDNKIEITTEILDSIQRTYKIEYTLFNDRINNPLLKISNLDSIDFIKKIDDKNYLIKSGTWKINRPLVLDNNLTIEKGTKLIFDENSYLIINGKLDVLGTSKKEVIFMAKNKNWKGIYVYNSEEKSSINYTKFYNLSNVQDGILFLTGGINFYKSNVEISNTDFINSYSEDFLNIIHSQFKLDNVRFSNSKSDAFDSDFSNGQILNSNFLDIKGDALDFSGSDVIIYETDFKNINDKSVSAGEMSNIEISFIKMTESGVGIASKDKSMVNINNSIFSKIKLYPLMTYQKKSFFGASNLSGENLLFDNNENCCFNQINSTMNVNGNQITGSELDVDKLYQSEIMKK